MTLTRIPQIQLSKEMIYGKNIQFQQAEKIATNQNSIMETWIPEGQIQFYCFALFMVEGLFGWWELQLA